MGLFADDFRNKLVERARQHVALLNTKEEELTPEKMFEMYDSVGREDAMKKYRLEVPPATIIFTRMPKGIRHISMSHGGHKFTNEEEKEAYAIFSEIAGQEVMSAPSFRDGDVVQAVWM